MFSKATVSHSAHRGWVGISDPTSFLGGGEGGISGTRSIAGGYVQGLPPHQTWDFGWLGALGNGLQWDMVSKRAVRILLSIDTRSQCGYDHEIIENYIFTLMFP